MKKKRITILTVFLILLFLPAVTQKANASQEEHYHGDIKYEPWPGTDNKLPQEGGYYYLTEDIIRSETASQIAISSGTVQHLCLNGHTISHTNTDNRLYTVKGELYLEDCGEETGGITYAGARASTCTYGGLIQVQRGGTLTMSGGQLYGLSATSETGAAVYVQGANTTARAIFNLLGGQIHSNTVGVCMTKSVSRPAQEAFSQVNIQGGAIWGNDNAITVTSDVLQITGGSITENGGKLPAVYVTEQVKLILSGAPQIIDNLSGNLYLPAEQLMELGQIEPGAKIGVTAENPGRIISTPADIPENCFQSDDPEYGIILQERQLFLGYAHRHPLAGEAQVNWIMWTDSDSLPEVSGNYRLEQDVILTREAVVGENVTLHLCLNGHSVIAPEGMRIMTVASGGQVHITDCRENCGTLSGGSALCGGGFYVMRQGSLTLYNGTIADNTAAEAGGAVYLQSGREDQPGGRFQMFGGQVSGGIYADQGSSLLLAGGKVTGVTVTERLQVQGDPEVEDIYLMGNACISAADLQEHAKLLISAQNPDRPITDGPVTDLVAGCFISQNRYRIIEHQDYIYLNTSREHMHCLCCSQNDSCDHTQNVWQAWESTTELPKASGYYYLVEDVYLKDQVGILGGEHIVLCLHGQAVYAANQERLFQVHTGGQLTVTDCLDSGKLTGGNRECGGAVNIMRGGTMRLYGGAITGNTAGTDKNGLGGAVYLQETKDGVAGGVFLMYGGAISNNTGYQGAIYADAGSHLAIRGGSITGNRSANHGGAVYLAAKAQAGVDSALIQGNTANKKGGGIYQSAGAALTVSNCRILDNTSVDTGSALYLDGEFVLEGCYITGNTAGKGTAVYVAPATGGQRQMGGDLWIWSNTGTMKADLYLGKGIIVTGTEAGFGRNTKIYVQIYSGFLTDTLLAAYDYEGGNRVYTVTYGTRSLTDPEKEPVTQKKTPKITKAAQETVPVKAQAPTEETAAQEQNPIAQESTMGSDAIWQERMRKGVLGVTILLTGCGTAAAVLRAGSPKKQ